ncbi:MAG: hypothetical protein ABIL40_07625 [candidate division WOR-3 bacterium]
MKIKAKFFVLLFSVGISLAEPWSLRVIVKRPYLSDHYDSLGNLVLDSLVRGRMIVTTIYNSGLVDSLSSERVTNDSGVAIFDFSQWHDGSVVDSVNIGRIDISFPTTYECIEVGGRITFRKLRYEAIPFMGRHFEEIGIVLPTLTVNLNEYTIGAGNFEFDFVVLTDIHINEQANHDYDFGSDGYDDYDDNPYETGVPISNLWSAILFINEQLLPTYPIKFIVLTGDITSSSERSEYERTKTLLHQLTEYSPSYPYDRIFYIPVMGNHDAWPYTPDGEMPSSDVTIGGYFHDAFVKQYDSLKYFFPIANYQESNLLRSPTGITGYDWPSYYFNFAFDYHQYHFICTDFNTREHAIIGYGICPWADVYRDKPWGYTWNWLHNQISNQKMVIFDHHPYRGHASCFSPGEIHEIAEAGLLNNHPPARSIGGHMHSNDVRWVLWDDDTICYCYTLEALKEGGLHLFHIRDSVNLIISQPEGNLVLPVTVYFQASYSYQGSYNAPINYYWEFGDGTGTYALTPTHIYHLTATLDTCFKVSVCVTKVDGRAVYGAKMIKVTASPYNFHTVYVKEDSVKLVWDFDQPDKVQYYIVKRNGVDIGHPTTKEFIDTQNNGLQRGQTYNYEVSVHYKSWVGHADSPAARLHGVQVPWVDAPTVRQPVDIPPNQVRISWHNNSNYAQKYIIHRWDAITNQWHYGYHQANSPIDTLFVDNVEWLHKYKYVVVARATNASYDTSAWSNVVEYSCGILAQSNYSKMSAYNNGAKVLRYGITLKNQHFWAGGKC